MSSLAPHLLHHICISTHLQSYEIRNKLRFGRRRKKKPMVGMYIKPTYICMSVLNVHNAWDEITHPFDDSWDVRKEEGPIARCLMLLAFSYGFFSPLNYLLVSFFFVSLVSHIIAFLRIYIRHNNIPQSLNSVAVEQLESFYDSSSIKIILHSEFKCNIIHFTAGWIMLQLLLMTTEYPYEIIPWKCDYINK